MTDPHVRAVGAPGVATPEVSELWRLARRQGMDRRRFLQALTAGGAAAVLAACGDSATTQRTQARFKDTTPFIVHEDGMSLETRLEYLPEG